MNENMLNCLIGCPTLAFGRFHQFEAMHVGIDPFVTSPEAEDYHLLLSVKLIVVFLGVCEET